jgi:5-methylcytosine-specific restriction endonuclease McrA
MQIDHIIPESLDGTAILMQVLQDFNLPANFNINSFGNWMPAHPRCNLLKSSHVFTPSPIIQKRLEDAAQRIPKAQELVDNYISDHKIDKAIQQLLIADERNVLKDEHWNHLVALVGKFHEKNRAEEERGHPFTLTPWLTIVGEADGFLYVRNSNGMVGVRPKGANLHWSWDCPRCGVTAWNGTRCVSCGMMDDGD